MAKDDPQFNLRIPPDLRRKITAAARENGRSVTAEINLRLEVSFVAEQPDSELSAIHEIIERANFLLRKFQQ